MLYYLVETDLPKDVSEFIVSKAFSVTTEKPETEILTEFDVEEDETIEKLSVLIEGYLLSIGVIDKYVVNF